MAKLQEAQAAVAEEEAAAPPIDDFNEPASVVKGAGIARNTVRRGGGVMGAEEEATPAEQKEMDRALGALTKVLYEDDNTSQSIVDQLRPEEKVGSVAKATILLVSQLDQRLDFDEVIVPALTQETADRVIDLYENVHGDEFNEQETQRVLGAAWEGVMEIYGVDEEAYEELTQGMSDEDLAGYEQQYKQFLGA